MANEQNLRPCEYKLTREDSSKGGKNSAKAKRKKKNLKECAKLLLEMGVTDKKNIDLLKEYGLDENDELTNGMLATVVMFNKLVKCGDVQTYKAFLEAEDKINGQYEDSEDNSLLLAIKEALTNESK